MNSNYRIIIFIFIIAVGCGPRNDLPSYQMNSPRVIQAGESESGLSQPPVIVIVEPKQGSSYEAGDSIDCTIKVELHGGARMPEVVNVSIRRGDALVSGDYPATPVERAERSCLLKIKLKAPKKPGDYEIAAAALETIVIQPQSSVEKSQFKAHWTWSPRVKFHVIKR